MQICAPVYGAPLAAGGYTYNATHTATFVGRTILIYLCYVFKLSKSYWTLKPTYNEKITIYLSFIFRDCLDGINFHF